ncbi:hypothetical protein L6452_37609 [Arctium lappa]|uniref:Uncharacterized protein n=1 Tax=Arctium lappa TaxID=4217 RepID=A0ACB8Y470_ARCLA|nr:hypothetical protein L6452_37609 [Arctium lappa]
MVLIETSICSIIDELKSIKIDDLFYRVWTVEAGRVIHKSWEEEYRFSDGGGGEDSAIPSKWSEEGVREDDWYARKASSLHGVSGRADQGGVSHLVGGGVSKLNGPLNMAGPNEKEVKDKKENEVDENMKGFSAKCVEKGREKRGFGENSNFKRGEGGGSGRGKMSFHTINQMARATAQKNGPVASKTSERVRLVRIKKRTRLGGASNFTIQWGADFGIFRILRRI